MARNSTIKVIRTTRAALNTQATAGGLLAGEPYFIIDEERFAVGTSTTTYQTYAKQSEASGSSGSGPVLHPGYVTGRWYSPLLDTVQRDAQPFANNLYARPIYIASATKLDSLGVATGYSASIGFTSAPAYLAIYNSANGVPTTRVAYGQISMSSSSTACTVSVTATSLPAGWYWLAYVSNTRTLVVSNPTTSFANNHLVGTTDIPSGSSVNGIAVSYAYAVPPTTFPTANSYLAADLPIVSWRASA